MAPTLLIQAYKSAHTSIIDRLSIEFASALQRRIIGGSLECLYCFNRHFFKKHFFHRKFNIERRFSVRLTSHNFSSIKERAAPAIWGSLIFGYSQRNNHNANNLSLTE